MIITNETFMPDLFPDNPVRRLGKAPAKSNVKALMMGNYMKAPPKLPTATNFWTKKKPIPLSSFGNMDYGDCTKASQANAALRMERIEQKKTIVIPEQSVIDSYLDMTKRLYGGGDTGAFETDALDDWRKPDFTFKDEKGRPLTIDAYLRVNHTNIDEIKAAMWTAKSHGIKICMNLPKAFMTPLTWDIPEGQPTIGDYLPGSWGGHSMFAEDYDKFGLIIPTWDTKVRVSWKAVLVYADEVHLVIDSINNWKKRVSKKELDLEAIKSDVNQVSSQKIK